MPQLKNDLSNRTMQLSDSLIHMSKIDQDDLKLYINALCHLHGIGVV